MKALHLNLLLCLSVLAGCQSPADNQQKGIPVEKDLSGSIMIEGTELNYSVKGKGTPFLVVGSSADYFSDNLLDNFRLYFIDIRGTAEQYSPIDTAAYTVETLMKDIDTLRAVLRLERFVIGGHSILGAISLQYARKHPERVSHVVMIGTPSIYGTEAFGKALDNYWAAAPEERKQLFEEKQKQLENATGQLSPREAMVKNIVAQSPKRWHDPNFDATPYLEKVHFNMDFVAHLFGKLFPVFDLCRNEEKLNIPIFIATGKSDYVSPPTLWDGECESLPQLTVSAFEKSGHTPHFEEPALFEERLVEWVGKN